MAIRSSSVCPPAPPGPSWPLLLLPRQDGGEVSQSLGETLKLPPRRFLPTGVSAWPLSSSASLQIQAHGLRWSQVLSLSQRTSQGHVL